MSQNKIRFGSLKHSIATQKPEWPTNSERIDHRFKAFPPTQEPIRLQDVPGQGWNALRDFISPVLILKENALNHNIGLMMKYCRANGVELAPHGKTTMSPQLIHRQLQAGAWGITAANASQARVFRATGVRRIVIANEVVDPVGLRWLGTELLENPDAEIYCLVDSEQAVNLMEECLLSISFTGRLPVLLELGFEGGRAGCRSLKEAKVVAEAVTRSRTLSLGGVEGYEGILKERTVKQSLAKVDLFLGQLGELALELDRHGAFGSAPEIIVTAGGTAYFDRVVANLGGLSLSRPTRLVLRCGCYLTHDHENYEYIGPMGRRLKDWERFVPALEVWGLVLSRPEPSLVIVGFGRRDVSFDRSLPHPLEIRKPGATGSRPSRGMRVVRLNDQHAYVRVDPADELSVGDLVGCGLSHPCSVFDKWRLIPLVDDAYNVIGAVETLF
jgi:D-serine dehydratase